MEPYYRNTALVSRRALKFLVVLHYGQRKIPSDFGACCFEGFYDMLLYGKNFEQQYLRNHYSD